MDILVNSQLDPYPRTPRPSRLCIRTHRAEAREAVANTAKMDLLNDEEIPLGMSTQTFSELMVTQRNT